MTRGPLGIPGLEPPAGFHGARHFYYLALGFAVLALGLIYLLASSRIGTTLKAIRQNEPLAAAQGIAALRYKLFAFAVGAAITGAAGGIYVFHLSIVDPLIMDFYYMQTFLIMVIIGGAGSFWGVALAGIAMSIVPELLRFSNELRMVMYGAVLIAVVAMMPGGIAGLLARRREPA
jgi:ABC-type branched-subunit amino acid transport system permease subunit